MIIRAHTDRWKPLLVAIACAYMAGCKQGDESQPQAAAKRQATTPVTAPLRASLALSLQTDDPRITAGQAAIRKHPTSIDAHVSLATILLRKSRETSSPVFTTYARDVTSAAASLDDSDSRVRLLQTMLLLDEHKFDAASRAARDLSTLRPNDPTPHLLLGDAQLELGNIDAAIEAYQAAIDLRPDLRSYNRGAYLRWLQGDIEGAKQVLELALQAGSARDPEGMAWCFVDLGHLYLHRGQSRRALAAAQRALDLVPGYLPARIVEAKARARQGQTAAAAMIMAEAVAIRPTAEDLLRLVELREALGDAQGAQEVRTMAERLAPSDPRPMARFLARRNEEPKRALALARAELESRKNLWSYDTLALAELRMGNLDNAEQAIAKALAWNTPDPTFHLHAGLIAAARHDAPRAQLELERALDMDPSVDPQLVDELKRAVGST